MNHLLSAVFEMSLIGGLGHERRLLARGPVFRELLSQMLQRFA